MVDKLALEMWQALRAEVVLPDSVPLFAPSTAGRLASLDALRGFDMFWIIGARALFSALADLHFPGSGFLASQLVHSGWNGFTFYDLVFPLFLFVIGVSLVFSLRRRLERGENRGTILRHILWRSTLLFLLGILYNGGFQAHFPWWESVRLMGVLQRAALVYLAASLLVLGTSTRTQALTAAGLLGGYWLLLRFIPVPGYTAGVLTPSVNMVRWVDLHLLPGQLYFDTWDPEGLLSTLPAIATGLFGVLAGHWLWAEPGSRSASLQPADRAKWLAAAGAALTVAGVLCGLILPINKPLWTSSYALLTGGLSALLLAFFYWLIDVRRHQKWALPFLVLGRNSLFIYLAANWVPFDEAARWLTAWNPLAGLLGAGQGLVQALAQLGLEWFILFWMFRRNLFVRI